MNFYEIINREQIWLSALRREFHRHPEPSLEEFWTCGRIEQELGAIGIPHRRVGDTGVLGTIRGGQPGTGVVALRADIDALRMNDEKDVPYRSACPGLMHSCGHDAHAASLLGAAKALWQNRGAFGGEIRLLFQQGEEIGQGARIFIGEGHLEGVERVFGAHMASDVPVGKVALYNGPSNASCDRFLIDIQGKAAHVSTPHKGVDALHVASQIVVALQGITARQINPIDSVIVGVGKLTAGTAYNILAETALLDGTTRSFTPALRSQVNTQVTQTATAIARLWGAKAAVEWQDYAAPLVNDAAVSKEVAGLVRKLWGDGALVTDRPLSLGADDFADFTALLPGTYAYIGSANPAQPDTTVAHHNGRFDIDEYALVVAASLYAQYAWEWLTGGL